jgi:hypothetical protein
MPTPTAGFWASLSKEDLDKIIRTDPSEYLQKWPMELLVEPKDKPLEAVRVHQAKGRSHWLELPSKEERLAYKFDKLRPIEADQESEQPYKDDPRYGTWG